MNKFLTVLAVLISSSALAETYVTSDAKTKTATLIVNASQGAAGGGLNFNGVQRGAKSFTVPVGYSVVVKFKNLGMMGHSAIVTKGKTPPNSITAKDAAFPNAYTPKLAEGLAMNATADLKFVAKTAGDYNIVCGVPGHNLGGQWLGLVISSSAKAATYK